MNRRAMIKPAFILSLAALALAGCNSQTPVAEPLTPPLEGSTIGGPFTLVDTAGETVSWSDFDGKYRIVYFGYAYCPDICPFDVQRLGQAYDMLEERDAALAAQVQPIFITVDPERDTPEVIEEFLSHFSDDFIGLTGTTEAIDEAKESFKIYAQKGEEEEGGYYLVDHSRSVLLMGRQGEPMALLPVDDGPEAITDEVVRWTS